MRASRRRGKQDTEGGASGDYATLRGDAALLLAPPGGDMASVGLPDGPRRGDESGPADADAAAALRSDDRDSPGLAAPLLRSYVDEIIDQEIRGWAFVPDRPSRRCVIILREEGQVLARSVASRFRADLLSAGIGDGCHSFVLPMPRALLDGDEHLLELTEEETGSLLTAEPIQWRSALGTAGAVTAGLANSRGDVTRFGDDWRQPEVEARHFPLMARGDHVNGRSAPQAGTRIFFDISDLIYYIGYHPNLTGIQRVQSSIVLAIAQNQRVAKPNLVIFLSFNAVTGRWLALPTGFLISLLEDLFLSQRQRLVSFSAEEARYGVLPGAQELVGAGVLSRGSRSVLCLLGAAWVNQDYFHRVLDMKRQFGTRFVMTIHDLIPIYARETCDQDTARVFEEFLQRAMRHVDHFLSVSESTAADLRRYARSSSLPEPPITVTLNGSSFTEFLPKDDHPAEIDLEQVPKRFVLFVATVEGRKNHKLIFDIWRRMVEDGDDPPHLVCIGRVGWKSDAFIMAMVETNYLDGRIILLQDISDAELRLLYDRCLFTLCPSLYEGWGLPVSEALAAGKICVCSDRASLPEVAGEFGVYIDIGDVERSWQVIRDLAAQPAAIEQLESNIRQKYEPVTWSSVAERVIAACEATATADWREPYPYPAIPYCAEISFTRLGRGVEGIVGDELLTHIENGRRGYFLAGMLPEQSFFLGEEARADGIWGQPENWGVWLCHGDGDIVLGLSPNESSQYSVFMRLRVSPPIADLPIKLLANGERGWQGSVGHGSKNVVLQVRRKIVGTGGWRLRIGVNANLSAAQYQEIAASDRRVPIIGIERLVVVPDNDLKTRVDILTALMSH